MSDKVSTCERVDYYKPDCKYFSGYKPCKFKRVCEGCEEYAPKRVKVLLINLDAMGDVERGAELLRHLDRVGLRSARTLREVGRQHNGLNRHISSLPLASLLSFLA